MSSTLMRVVSVQLPALYVTMYEPTVLGSNVPSGWMNGPLQVPPCGVKPIIGKGADPGHAACGSPASMLSTAITMLSRHPPVPM
jgi:hypothetical protein